MDVARVGNAVTLKGFVRVEPRIVVSLSAPCLLSPVEPAPVLTGALRFQSVSLVRLGDPGHLLPDFFTPLPHLCALRLGKIFVDSVIRFDACLAARLKLVADDLQVLGGASCQRVDDLRVSASGVREEPLCFCEGSALVEHRVVVAARQDPALDLGLPNRGGVGPFTELLGRNCH